MKKTVFPFTAIVGQDDMKLSLILNAVDPHIGGVLVKGERGTAKSTAARALADLLPQQAVIRNCRFGCDPFDKKHYCDACEAEYAKLEPEIQYRKTPFVNLPISATEDRIVGTLDFEKALTDGKRHFEPGLFADVNRGILYVDEVNLLEDHIVDTLLDAAAMGINHVEREGVSFSHPARFIMIGTMNPEEGDLRPQLLDRFGHSVQVKGETDPDSRMEIITRAVDFEQDPEGFSSRYEKLQTALSDRITNAQKLLPGVTYNRSILQSITELTTSYHVEGHRADIVILKTAKANAAFENRSEVTAEDVITAAKLTLPHRIISGHGINEAISTESIGEKAAEILSHSEPSGYTKSTSADDPKKKRMN